MPLVKYEHAFLVGDNSSKAKIIPGSGAANSMKQAFSKPVGAAAAQPATNGAATGTKLPPVLAHQEPSLPQSTITASPNSKHPSGSASGTGIVQASEDVVESILPPKMWEDQAGLWCQKVSMTPATRLDVLALQDQLDNLLQKRQARETGICPVRRELYDQCFDELIRQVAISCQERGLLLLRVRDESRMTLDSYQKLYESSTAFGMRKLLSSEDHKHQEHVDNGKNEEELKLLRQKIIEYQADFENLEKKAQEKRAMDEKKFGDEISQLKKVNLQLKAQLDAILNVQKKN